MNPNPTPPGSPLWPGLAPADWSLLANLATIAGVLIAVFAGLIALGTYRSANRNAGNSHMHSLFRDYLRTRFDHEVARAHGTATDGLDGEVASIKLYVLEEMWAWVASQRRAYHHWGPLRLLPRVRQRRQALDAWCATINSHISIDEEEVLANLEGNAGCYSTGFLRYLARNFDDPRFGALIEASKGREGPLAPGA